VYVPAVCGSVTPPVEVRTVGEAGVITTVPAVEFTAKFPNAKGTSLDILIGVIIVADEEAVALVPLP
jgi:hypothetical protein